MKDIFIDNNVAIKLNNPVGDEYKELIEWLRFYSEDSAQLSDLAHLVVSHKLLNEYYRSSSGCKSGSSIVAIIDVLTRQGRLVKKTNSEIDQFLKRLPKRVANRLQCNHEDRPHIATICLSVRKIALVDDTGLFNDLSSLPGHEIIIGRKPTDVSYR